MIENSGLTVSDFKAGMKVSFIDAEWSKAAENSYTVKSIDCDFVYIDNGEELINQGWFPWRFNIIAEAQPATFDYLQAMKHYILDQDVELEYEAIDGEGWINAISTEYLVFQKDRKYRFKPKKIKQTFQFLIKSKGKYSVTKNKYEDEDQVKKGYTYPVEVIQKLEG